MRIFAKILLVFIIITEICIIPVIAKDANYYSQESKLYEYDKENYHSINIGNKKYSCIGNNCYDLKSFKYNKLLNTYYINTFMNLINCNAHQEYKSQYNDGYINHLIFKTSLRNGKITIKCIGFVVSDIIPIYKNGQSYSMYYDNMIVHMVKPKTIKINKELIDSFYNWIDIDNYNYTVKTLANNSKD